MSLKPGRIGHLNRAAVARTRTVWLSTFSDHGAVRDIVQGARRTEPFSVGDGVRVITPEGPGLAYAGSGNGALSSIRPLAVTADLSKLAFIARVRITGTQPGNPGAAFGIYSDGAQGGFGIGFNGNTVGGAWLSGSGAGAAGPVTITQGEWYTVVVQGIPNSLATDACRTWVSNGGKNTGGSSGGALNGAMNTIAVGAMYRSSGFLRQFLGEISWAAVLEGDTAFWMTDEIAADLFKSDYPRALLEEPDRASLWGAFVASGPVAVTSALGLTAVLQRAASASALFSSALQTARGATSTADAGVVATRSATGLLSASTLGASTAQGLLSQAVQNLRSDAATVDAALAALHVATAGLQSSVAAGTSSAASLDGAVETPHTAAPSLSVVAARNEASGLLVQILAQARTVAALGADLQVRVGSASSVSLLLGVRSGVFAGAQAGATVELANARLVVGSAAVRAALRATGDLSVAVRSLQAAATTCDGYVSVGQAAASGMSAVIEGDAAVKLATLSAALQTLVSSTSGMSATIAQAQTAALGLQASLAARQTVQAAFDATVDAGAALPAAVGAYVYDPSAEPVPARAVRRWVVARELRRWVVARQPRSWRVKG